MLIGSGFSEGVGIIYIEGGPRGGVPYTTCNVLYGSATYGNVLYGNVWQCNVMRCNVWQCDARYRNVW